MAPFRGPLHRPSGDPAPLPYLQSVFDRSHGGVDMTLEVSLQTCAMRERGEDATRISRGNAIQAAYWSAAQLVAHHTVNGCNLRPGDMLGSGTLSGPDASEAGSLLERTFDGKQPLLLPDGELRTFLEDGDTVSFHAYCMRDSARRIGFGTVFATVTSA